MTRRHFLAGLSLPLLPLGSAARDPLSFTILSENHLLSQESAAAYAALLAPLSPPRRTVILLPGTKQLSLADALTLRRTLEAGASFLIECGLAFSTPAEIQEHRRVLRQALAIQVSRPIAAAADPQHHYVAFASGNLVRPFGLTFPVFHEAGQPLAHFGETPVAFKARVGRGTLIFLGTMLGPHLEAFDSDGLRVAADLLTDLNF
jgi:hypothetical protein